MCSKTCCFTGHRTIAAAEIPSITQRLEETVDKLINQGVVYYGCGGAIGFDTLAALAVLRLRRVYKAVKLIMVLPCRGQDANWPEKDKASYQKLLSASDKIVYVSERYHSGCMQKRNRHLVDNSGYCVCYLTKNSGGTKYTVDYAIKKGLKIIKLP